MLIDRILAQLSSERFHPAADGYRCRDPQPNIKQNSGSLVAETWEGLREPGVKYTTRRHIELTNLGQGGLTETEPPNKWHPRPGPRFLTHM